MAQESIKGWGGSREGAGPKVAVPSGEGEKVRLTISVGSDLLEKLRGRWPDLSDQDLLRAALWEAIGEPKV